MLKTLRRKALTFYLPVLLVLGAVVIGLLVHTLPSTFLLLRGPRSFDPWESPDPSRLRGRYLKANIVTLVDYYAETVDSSGTVHSRKYLLPVETNDGIVFIGVEIPRSKLDRANGVMASAQHLMDNPDADWDGTYVAVRGTLRVMNEKESSSYRRALTQGGTVSESEIGLRGSHFRTLILVDGAVGVFDSMFDLVTSDLLTLCILVLWCFLFYSAVNGSWQNQIRHYLAAQPDPRAAEHQLDQLVRDRATLKNLHISRSWLLYVTGVSSFVLSTQDVVWAYTQVTNHRTNFVITERTFGVMVCSASEPAEDGRHFIPVKNEQQAQKLLELLSRICPNAVFGYTALFDKMYKTDPKSFSLAVRAAQMPLP